MQGDFEIRQLHAGDAAAYRATRLQALRDEPEAFGNDHAEAAGRPEEHWSEILGGSKTFFGCFQHGRIVSCANMERLPGVKLDHRAIVYGVYTDPEFRGRGLGVAVIEAIARHARSIGVLQLHLGVGTANAKALKAYEKAGFRPYGNEPRALRVGERFVDEVLMVRMLDEI